MYQLQVIEKIDTVVVTTAEILQLSKAIKADTDTIKNIHEMFQFTHRRIKIEGREFIGEIL